VKVGLLVDNFFSKLCTQDGRGYTFVSFLEYVCLCIWCVYVKADAFCHCHVEIRKFIIGGSTPPCCCCCKCPLQKIERESHNFPLVTVRNKFRNILHIFLQGWRAAAAAAAGLTEDGEEYSRNLWG